jgi:hypothetical protein
MERKSRDSEKRGNGEKGGGDEKKGRRRKTFIQQKTGEIRGHGKEGLLIPKAFYYTCIDVAIV